MGSIGFRFWVEFFRRMVRLDLVYTRQGYLIMVMSMGDHWLGVRYFHRYRDLNMFFAHLFDNFRALLLVTVTLDNLVIFFTLLLKRLYTLLFWHIHRCGQALSSNSEKVQNQFLVSLLETHLVLHWGTISVRYLTLSSMWQSG